MQSVHLKTLSPLGHLDKAPHVIQLPEAKSLSPAGLVLDGLVYCTGAFAFAFAFDLEPGPSPNISASESESESKSSGEGFLGDSFFLAENRAGNGWLLERL